ncbi:Sideroflexin 1 [Aphelenchoides avenae]|nr:Sideroflexin 1 [Aphelenchus avenae]
MSTLVRDLQCRPDISRSRWDQKTFDGRFKHFFAVTNPMNLVWAFVWGSDECRTIVQNYRKGIIPADLTVNQLWRYKHVCDSAFHPETGEKLFVLGRMSSKTYNAGVNYSNRAGENAPTGQRLFGAYLCATGGAVGSALALESWAKNRPPLVTRLIPFVSVALANMINIPIIRANEFTHGITVETESGEKLGKSTYVSRHAISMVVVSRISISIPCLVIVPICMQRISQQQWAVAVKRPGIAALVQTVLTGFMLTFTTPLGCAIFAQRSEAEVDRLEEPLRQQISSRPNAPKVVYYNKGL